ncbi:hypothetical protein [Candidatus Amarobacter glycogenicus]|uniref:hypothetical protein n=1 Tax=Candidatus Amarobacter glycogenicus TaxID=3140699 RepID=UPI002A1291FA|nr:hypothetical protein [Dehalococcoidia bacterium]
MTVTPNQTPYEGADLSLHGRRQDTQFTLQQGELWLSSNGVVEGWMKPESRCSEVRTTCVNNQIGFQEFVWNTARDKARITCLCGPMGSVRQTAGRTLLLERSSNGNGTRMTLCFVTEWLPIAQRVDIFSASLRKANAGLWAAAANHSVSSHSVCGGIEDDHPHPLGAEDRQQLIQFQLTALIHSSGQFDGRHRGFMVTPPQAANLVQAPIIHEVSIYGETPAELEALTPGKGAAHSRGLETVPQPEQRPGLLQFQMWLGFDHRDHKERREATNLRLICRFFVFSVFGG